MTRLYICEKPSLAKVLASNLGKPVKKSEHYEVNGDYVAWLKGHIIEFIQPDEYKPEWTRKKCSYAVLPMFPDKFKNKVKAEFGCPEIYKGICSLAASSDIIVNVGDPDREGQYLVDEVIEKIGWSGPTERLLINAYDDATVKKALKAVEDNRSSKNYNMFRSAFCRSVTDWLIGMNGSRKFSLDAGYNVVVGRVQVPILALVYRRNYEIDNFKPVKYYKVKASNQADLFKFVSEWKPSEDEKSHGFDSEERLIDRNIALDISAKVTGHDGSVLKVIREHKKTAQPLPYSLATLQKDACSKLGISLKQLDDALQALYEKHKLLTYPRSDCEYIPESQFSDAADIISVLLGVPDSELSLIAKNADSGIKSRAFNTSKTTAHHAIIPTGETPDWSSLTKIEQGVYCIAAKRYLLQFYPVYEYDFTKFVINCENEQFEATGSVVTELGWKKALGKEEVQDRDAKEENAELPDLKEGDSVFFAEASVVENETKPPERFTQESLITALCNAHKYVKDASCREVIKDIKGLGTPATRSKIIEKLLERGTLIEREVLKGKKKRKILYTAEEVKELIDALPEDLTYPDRTALIELLLDKVATGELSETQYMEKIKKYINELMLMKGNFTRKLDPTKPVCPVCGKGSLYLHDGKYGKFWSCSRYKEGCSAIFDDDKGKPVIVKCPSCGKGFLRRSKSKAGNYFWGCSAYKETGCRAYFADEKGHPDIPPPPVKCPDCGKDLRRITTRNGKFWVCDGRDSGCNAPWFPDVKGKPQIIPCPNCGKGYLIKREGKNGPFFSCSNYSSCKTFYDVDSKTGKPVFSKRKK